MKAAKAVAALALSISCGSAFAAAMRVGLTPLSLQVSQRTAPANTQPGVRAPSSSGPDPLAPLYAQAQQSLDHADYDAAIIVLQKILAARPGDALPHFEIGYAYSELKRNDEAAAEYRQAISLDPSLIAAHLNLGLVLLDSDPAAAAASFERAAALQPDQARPLVLAGEALERAGKFTEAITEYNLGLALAPGNQVARFGLARALLSAGRASDAESQFRQTIALANAVTVSGGAPLAGGPPQPETNATNPGQLQANVTSFLIPAKLGLAECLLRESKNSEAADAFGDYLAAAPGDREARFERAVALQDLDRFDDALVELDRADNDGAPTPNSLKLRGSILMQQRKWAAAAASLEKAVAALPKDAEVHAWLGHSQMELHNDARGEQELRSSLALDPNSEVADGVLGDLASVTYAAGHHADALAALDTLEKRHELTSINWFIRAICYDKLARKSEAAAAYRNFLDLDHGTHADQDFQARHRLELLQRELKK